MFSTKMKSNLIVLFAVTLLAAFGDEAAAKSTGVKAPVYDEEFMRKLCAFLGATYVRSAKDPMCWYTWCHNGEPYHMQCPAGRAVSQHFYWSTEDPCTESDVNEQCLVGFLKNMHLGNQNFDDEFSKQEDPEVVVVTSESPQLLKEEKEEEAPENTIQGYDQGPAEEKLEVTEDYYKSPQEDGGARQAPLTEKIVHEPEPIPEAEPTVLEPPQKEEYGGFIVRKIEAEEPEEDNVYFPEHHRAHIVEAFVPRSPVPLYGGYRRYNGPFHYFPQKFYPAPVKEHALKRLQFPEGAEEPDEPIEKVKIRTTSEPEYLPPMARSARLRGRQQYRNQPSYSRPEGHENHYRSPAEYNREYDYQPEYMYEGTQNVTTPENTNTQLTTNVPRENREENNAERDHELASKDGQHNEADEVGATEESPAVYDYFKTHFIEEI